MHPFHLAIPVTDLTATRCFYVDMMGCRVGRSAETWIDFDLYGHQLSTHLRDAGQWIATCSAVDGFQVPVPHFGVVLTRDQWNDLAQRLEQHGVEFIIKPYIRFKGLAGEQGTLFIRDPSGNHLEFKSFVDNKTMFSTGD